MTEKGMVNALRALSGSNCTQISRVTVYSRIKTLLFPVFYEILSVALFFGGLKVLFTARMSPSQVTDQPALNCNGYELEVSSSLPFLMELSLIFFSFCLNQKIWMNKSTDCLKAEMCSQWIHQRRSGQKEVTGQIL